MIDKELIFTQQQFRCNDYLRLFDDISNGLIDEKTAHNGEFCAREVTFLGHTLLRLLLYWCVPDSYIFLRSKLGKHSTLTRDISYSMFNYLVPPEAFMVPTILFLKV